jgi:hypothetical protein
MYLQSEAKIFKVPDGGFHTKIVSAQQDFCHNQTVTGSVTAQASSSPFAGGMAMASTETF